MNLTNATSQTVGQAIHDIEQVPAIAIVEETLRKLGKLKDHEEWTEGSFSAEELDSMSLAARQADAHDILQAAGGLPGQLADAYQSVRVISDLLETGQTGPEGPAPTTQEAREFMDRSASALGMTPEDFEELLKGVYDAYSSPQDAKAFDAQERLAEGLLSRLTGKLDVIESSSLVLADLAVQAEAVAPSGMPA